MKVVCVLVIMASFVALSAAQGDFYSMLMLSNLLGGGGGQSEASQGVPGMASRGASGSAGGNAAAMRAALAGGRQGGRGSGGNGFMEMGALTGQFGDRMRDMSMCNMFRGTSFYSICYMQAITGGGSIF
ncbi:uncharacterized protein LOC128246489 [Mya arenaria]|uniref:uncharacterized protein LOC128246489 n=1 Tax=Mya arenaria TaxID=6604 RepID=UPI0022DEDF5E|nr:uncharacterized protein LOC128246489 [Mya arenaria]